MKKVLVCVGAFMSLVVANLVAIRADEALKEKLSQAE